MKTGRAERHRRISRRRSRSLACMQPSDAATPIVSGDCVPWTAIRSRPSQAAGEVGLVGRERDRAAAVGRSRAAHLELVGDGEAAGRRLGGRAPRRRSSRAPSTRPRSRTVSVRDERSIWTETSVAPSRARAGGIQPGRRVRPLGHDDPQPRAALPRTLRTRGPPNSVRRPIPPTARPPGAERSATRRSAAPSPSARARAARRPRAPARGRSRPARHGGIHSGGLSGGPPLQPARPAAVEHARMGASGP